MTEGTQDSGYAGDSACGILMAGTTDEAVGRTINLGSGHEVTINELAREAEMALGRADLLGKVSVQNWKAADE